MSDRTLSVSPVKAHPLPKRLQAFYGQISGFDPLRREAFLDIKATVATDSCALL